MVQKDLNGHLDRVNLLIQLAHGQEPPPRVTLSELFLEFVAPHIGLEPRGINYTIA